MTAAIQDVDIELRGAALRLLSCRDAELLISGPAGTGKSRACMIKLHLAALKYPGADLLVVRKTAKSLSSSFTTEWESLIREALQAGIVRFWGPTPRRPAQYRYSNGSTVTLGGLDDPIKIMSTQRDIIYVQEATEVRQPDWDAMNTRLRAGNLPYQQLLADCNPDAETHWLKQRANGGKTTLLISTHRDNPRYFTADGKPTEVGAAYLDRLDNLTGVRLLRLRDGLWAAAEGIIWESWDPTVHVIPRKDIPWDWPRIWSVDFGMRHPFVWQAWAVAPDGELIRYREIHMSGRIVEDHARQIMSLVRPGSVWNDKARRWDGGQWVEPKPQKILCDHDAEDRETLARYLDMNNSPADKRVKPGLEAVEKRLRDRRVLFMEGSLVEVDQQAVDERRPTCTEEEIPGYVWDDAKEAPVKEDDDGCDTLRYVVADQDLKPYGPIYRSFEG